MDSVEQFNFLLILAFSSKVGSILDMAKLHRDSKGLKYYFSAFEKKTCTIVELIFISINTDIYC
jgi:hypothetical protein